MAPLKSFSELAFKKDKNLPNLKVPVKGKRGVSKFMRKKVITKAKDDLNASVQSADRKPEKYIKPDGKVGIRMVKTDKEVIKKESSFGDNSLAARLIRMKQQKKNQKKTDDKEVIKKEQMQVYRVGHKDMSGNVHATTPEDAMKKLRKKGLKGDIKLTHRGSARSMPIRKIRKEEVQYPHMMYDPKTGNEVKAKTPADHNKYAKMGYTHEKPKVDEASMSPMNLKRAEKFMGPSKNFNQAVNLVSKGMKVSKQQAIKMVKKILGVNPKTNKIDEALTLQQRMKRSRLMKRLKTRIKIGRERARRKMANKQKLEKRAMRQARAQIAKKLTRGIPKSELSFARKQEIEKRLEKPAFKQRIKRIAKRIFKDVRKKEVQRKKG